MKRILTTLMIVAMLFALSACGGNGSVATNRAPATAPTPSSAPNESDPQPVASSEPTESTPADLAETADARKALVAYFSKTGNTEAVANMIAAATGATLIKVEPATPYPEDYTLTTEVALEEQCNNARPALASHVENMADYDVIYLGYPNWWGTMPMAMFTFLEEYDFFGKTIAPFCTHAGSAMGRSEADIAALCPNATLLPGLAVRGSAASGAQADVEAWLDGLGIVG